MPFIDQFPESYTVFWLSNWYIVNGIHRNPWGPSTKYTCLCSCPRGSDLLSWNGDRCVFSITQVIFFKLRHNSRTIKFATLKYTVQWFQCIHKVLIPAHFIAPKTPYPLVVTLYSLFSPFPLPQATLICFLSLWFAYSIHFMLIESYNMVFCDWLLSFKHNSFKVCPDYSIYYFLTFNGWVTFDG